jgi:pimeloyl-ACP methyl ester carboxylesterase
MPDLRIAAVNRRGYAPSSIYDDEEWEDLAAGKQVFLERTALEVATFLLNFAEEIRIPPVNSEGTRGGFALVGWSLGTVFALALTGQTQAVPPDMYQGLERYLRKIVMFGERASYSKIFDNYLLMSLCR